MFNKWHFKNSHFFGFIYRSHILKGWKKKTRWKSSNNEEEIISIQVSSGEDISHSDHSFSVYEFSQLFHKSFIFLPLSPLLPIPQMSNYSLFFLTKSWVIDLYPVMEANIHNPLRPKVFQQYAVLRNRGSSGKICLLAALKRLKRKNDLSEWLITSKEMQPTALLGKRPRLGGYAQHSSLPSAFAGWASQSHTFLETSCLFISKHSTL